MRKPFIQFFCTAMMFFVQMAVFSQSNSVNSFDCPIIDKRNNGNGQSNQSAGIFPGYGQNNPVAANVVGTPYQTVPYDPATKTGNINFKWITNPPVTPVNLPVITRVWITASGVSSLMSVKFGPPPPAVLSGGAYYVNYHFYVQNIPPQGTLTLEFSDPNSRQPVKLCSYDLQTGAAATTPAISCAPTITTQPANQNLCGDASAASFSVVADGVAGYQWQVYNGSTWVNVSNGGNYSGTTTSTLSIANPTSYDGKQYKVVLTGNGTCGNTTSSIATLVAKPKPTAQFNTTSYCGIGSRSIRVDLTGIAPWSFTYTTNGGSAVTVSGINTNPYYFSVNPASATTYAITSVIDAYCSNLSPTGNTSTSISVAPTITPSNTTVCYGSSSFSLAYSSTGTPTTYSITAGTRAMAGFTAISNASLTSSPMSVTIPSNIAAGTYDFNLVAASGGCSSASVPFTVTINAAPGVTATVNSASICSGATATLTAAGASTYSWVSSPSGFTSTSPSPSVSPTVNTTYTVTGTGLNGCTASASVSVTVKALPTVSISASVTSVCSSGQQVTLTASGANTYSWSGGTPSVSGTDALFIVTPSATGTYTVTGTGSNGCANTASQEITFTSGPTLTLTSNVSICQGSSTTLTANGATSYSWTPSSTLSASTGASVTATPTSTTTYTVYGTTSGCTSSKQVTVTLTSNDIQSVTPSNVFYCSQDINSGSKSLTLSISTLSNQSFTWQESLDNGSTYSTVSTSGGSRYAIAGTNPTTSSTLTYTNPFGNTQYLQVIYTIGSCQFVNKFNLKTINTNAPVVASDQSICSGTTPSQLALSGTVTAGNSGKTFSYQWQVSTTSSSAGFSDISGANTSAYSPGSLSANTWYKLNVTSTSTNCPGPYASNVVAITIGSSISNNSTSITDACVAGSAITGTSPTGGTGSFTYSWEYSTTSSSAGFSNIAGITTQSYTPSVPSQTTWFRRLVTSGSCSNSTSAAVVLYPPVISNSISNGQTVCSGVSLTALSVSPAGGPSGSSFTYLWYSSIDNSTFSSTGTTTSTYAPTTSVGTKYYKVVVTNGACSSTSNVATIVINSLPTVSVTASTTSLCGSGASSTLTGSGAVSYAWSPITGLSPTTGSVVEATPNASTTYTLTGTDANGCANTATKTLTYSSAPTTPTVGTATQTICSGTVNLSTKATGTNPTWYTAPVANASYAVSSPTSVSTAGTYYVFGYDGSACYSQSYATYTLSVANVSVSVNDNAVEICSGNSVDLTSLQSVAASGTTLQWYTDNTHSSTVVSPTAVSTAGTYYLFAYSSAGSCYGSSASATVTVISVSTPTLTSAGPVTLCSPNTVDLDSYYSASGGLTYNWYTSSSPSPSNIVLNKDAVAATGTYYLYATDVNGCRSSNSSGLSITLNPLPTASLSSPDPYCGDESRTLTVTTDASSPTYIWEESTNGGQSWTQIYDSYKSYTGSNTNALYISSTTNPILSGYYFRATVTKSGCSTTSSSAILVGQSTASITTDPTNATIYANSNGTFSVSYEGIAESIQWQSSATLNGTYTNLTEASPYSGVDKSTMLITNPSTSLTGYYYRAVITNTCGNATTSPAALTVLGPLPVNWNGFSVKQVADKVVVNWSTSSEQNSDVFIVQHSNDGRYWNDIGTVKAAGNSMKPLYYSFDHVNPDQGENYYRILQKDFDGRTTKSSVQHIAIEKGMIVFKIITQPAQHGLIQAQATRPMQAVLFSQQGQVLQQFNLSAGYNELRVNTYASGIYFIKAEGKVYKVMLAGN